MNNERLFQEGDELSGGLDCFGDVDFADGRYFCVIGGVNLIIDLSDCTEEVFGGVKGSVI